MLSLTLVERVVHTIGPYFVAAGLWIIAAGVLFERSIFIGLVVPGDLILALGGVYASRGRMSLALVVLTGTLAAIAGESTGFALGRRFGRRIVKRVPYIGDWLHGKLRDSEAYFRRHGGKTVAIGRYATAAGAFIPFTAGASRMSYGRFLLWDVPAIAVWAVGISCFGYYFGRNLAFVDKALSRFGYAVLGLVVAFFLGRYLWKRFRPRRDGD
jgi:undecaprenyl-diphosphatase